MDVEAWKLRLYLHHLVDEASRARAARHARANGQLDKKVGVAQT